MSQKEMSIFWEVIVSVIPSKKAYMYVSYSEQFHVIAHIKEHQDALRQATRHILTRVAKCTDVDGGIFENVLC
jgi:hypothetical protein